MRVNLKHVLKTFTRIILGFVTAIALLSGSLVVVVYASYGRVCNDSSIPVWVSTETDFSRAPDRWQTFPLEPGECTPKFRDGEGIWTYRNHTPDENGTYGQCELLILKVGPSTLHFEDGGFTDNDTHQLRITSSGHKLSWVTAASRVESWALVNSGISLADLEADIDYYIQMGTESDNCGEVG